MWTNTQLPGVSLEKKCFSGMDLSWINFKGAKLYKTKFYKVELYGADFHGASMQRTEFKNCVLTYADIWGADLRDAIFIETTLGQANLRGTDLRGARLENIYLYEANLRGTDLRGTDFRGADLREADLSGAIIDGDTDFSEARLDGAIFSKKPIMKSLEDVFWDNFWIISDAIEAGDQRGELYDLVEVEFPHYTKLLFGRCSLKETLAFDPKTNLEQLIEKMRSLGLEVIDV